MPTMSHEHVSVSEAARLLHVSRRTIQRRLDAGTLHSVEVGGVRRVVLDGAFSSAPESETAHATERDTDAQVSQLRARVEVLEAELREVRQDRDRWHEHAQRQGATIDRLTVTLAQLGDTVVEQRALASGATEPDVGGSTIRAPSKPWWRFWAR